jgi:prolyl-tRNA synthetase
MPAAMRWSATLIPTLREAPAEATARSHALMLRAGLVRQVASGSYAYLPLGVRVLNKLTALVRREMERAGAAEVLMPGLWPEELMQASGRLDAFAEDLFRLEDRSGRPHLLAPTHEELVTAIMRDEVRSYRQLPLTLFQVQTKFRDEPRPRFGVVRTREFIMKDAYSFSADEAGLDAAYGLMRDAYGRILSALGLPYVVARAESGAMGGLGSEEFIVPCAIGTADFVRCPGCGYAANVEAAAVPAPPQPAPASDHAPVREVETPGQTTIEQVSAFLGVRPDQLIKTLIYLADGAPAAALVRGDHDVNEAKLARLLGARRLELADAETIRRATGAPVGFAGPVGLTGMRLVADRAVMAVRDGVSGANRADAHMVGVLPGRDFAPDTVDDIRYVMAGDGCPECGAALEMRCGIEVGHVFRLGTKYSEALGATFADAQGRQRPFVMGCYGLGVSRLVAAAVECLSDEHGIVWPAAVAPHEAVVMALNVKDERIMAAAEDACARLEAQGVDTLLDDRNETPGVKFNDADLIGFPVRVVVGRTFKEEGKLEVQSRRDGSRRQAAIGEVAAAVKALLNEKEGER